MSIATFAEVRTIYCIGRNYSAHAKELNNPVPETEPVVFLKSSAALRGLQEGPLAFASEQFHHETEVVLLVGKSVPLGGTADWRVVEALTLGLDVTRRQVQSHLKANGLPWTTAKSFAGSAVVAPFVPRDQFRDLQSLTFTLHIREVLKQRGSIKDMIFPVPAILTFLASLNELRPGDLVFTGTPEGVGPLRQGDEFRLAFENEGHRWSGVF